MKTEAGLWGLLAGVAAVIAFALGHVSAQTQTIRTDLFLTKPACKGALQVYLLVSRETLKGADILHVHELPVLPAWVCTTE